MISYLLEYYYFSESFMEREIHDYEIGKRHLARIMGADPDNFTQEDIDVNTFDFYGVWVIGHSLDISIKHKCDNQLSLAIYLLKFVMLHEKKAGITHTRFL